MDNKIDDKIDNKMLESIKSYLSKQLDRPVSDEEMKKAVQIFIASRMLEKVLVEVKNVENFKDEELMGACLTALYRAGGEGAKKVLLEMWESLSDDSPSINFH